MNEKEKMIAGELYNAGDIELKRSRLKAQGITRLYNQTGTEEVEERLALLDQLGIKRKSHVHLEPNFRCDYGFNISLGEGFYANYDCIMLDICPIMIGDQVLFGPRVSLYTASHPLDAIVRAGGLECGKPIIIGNRVWLGGNTVVNPGVTIGDNVVIGSGSVVTKDIPSDCVAGGNPCRVIRKLTKEDALFWEEQVAVYQKK